MPSKKAADAASEKKESTQRAAKSPITFEIVNEIEVLSTNSKSGWSRELNVVSWNGGKPKYDLRDWSPDHSKMSKGIGLTADELAVLKEVLQDIDPYEIED